MFLIFHPDKVLHYHLYILLKFQRGNAPQPTVDAPHVGCRYMHCQSRNVNSDMIYISFHVILSFHLQNISLRIRNRTMIQIYHRNYKKL